MSRYRMPTVEDIEDVADRIGMSLSEGEAERGASYADNGMPERLEGVPVESLRAGDGDGDQYHVAPFRPSDDENPNNAWITRFELDRPDADGQLAGLPTAIKDNLAVRGSEMTCASRGFENVVPGAHATVVERLLAAGASLRGKTNMDELGMGPSSESSAFDPVTNPHSDEHVAGGSSSGSAAAVGEGEVDLALGSDTGGSIRIPSSYCGVVGLKPTHGRVPKRGFVTQAASLDDVGPIATDVTTAAKGMEVISDPLPNGERESFDDLGTDLADLKIGVIDRYMEEFAEDDVFDRVANALDDIEAAGATVDSVSIPELEYVGPAWWGIGPVEFAAAFATNDIGLWDHHAEIPSLADGMARVGGATSADIGTIPKEVILMGAHMLFEHDGYHYVRAQNLREVIKDALDETLETYDVLAAPSTPTTAMELGAFGSEEMPSPNGSLCAGNVAGHPSLTLPCGTSDGLPVGLQFLGSWYDDRTLLDVAAEYETLRDE
ncbi:amidase [Haloprofundus salilacus]|uniref:amidase n=1 Tax=Haloprofundus salilacus TaxID=2876190 RepID=UPI001CCB40CB|nr:amidase family protein [Haloprofundus salilacus]